MCLYHDLVLAITDAAARGYFYVLDDWAEHVYLRVVIVVEGLVRYVRDECGVELAWERPLESLSDVDSMDVYVDVIRPGLLAARGRLLEAHIRSGEAAPPIHLATTLAAITDDVHEWAKARRATDERLMARLSHRIDQNIDVTTPSSGQANPAIGNQTIINAVNVNLASNVVGPVTQSIHASADVTTEALKLLQDLKSLIGSDEGPGEERSALSADVESLEQELQKPEPSPKRVSGFWARLGIGINLLDQAVNGWDKIQHLAAQLQPVMDQLLGGGTQAPGT